MVWTSKTGRSNGYVDLDRVQPSARMKTEKAASRAVSGRADCGMIQYWFPRLPMPPLYQETGISGTAGTSGRLGRSQQVSPALDVFAIPYNPNIYILYSYRLDLKCLQCFHSLFTIPDLKRTLKRIIFQDI